MMTFMIAAGILLVASVLMRTYYTVADGVLEIVSGFFSWSIPIVEITRVSASSSPFSSPALSLDRLRIDYGAHKHILVSPQDKAGFLRAIEQTASA
ncbi:MAG: PH domain-containing protein [Gammaproteobacteria bacterium]|nr:PH domain-containing protein [Gammaproteobacteria bacterium]